MTAEYTKTREQFDRPIATFQAVGQRAADAYIDTEAIRLTAWQAIWRLVRGAARRRPRSRWRSSGPPRAASASCTPRSTCTAAWASTSDYPLHRYFLLGEEARAHARRRDAAAAEARSHPRRRARLGVAEIRSEARHLERREIVSRVVEHDGLRIAALDWGGDGEPLVLLHPNGFCAGFFDPLARRLSDTFRPIGVDLRGHGGTDAPRDAADFALLAPGRPTSSRCSTTSASTAGSRSASRAAVASRSWSTEQRPGAMRQARAVRGDRVRPRGARRSAAGERAGRRRELHGRDRAQAPAGVARPGHGHVRSYGSRPPLDALAPESLDAYMRWGFVDRADGQVELACAPEAEAAMFEMSAADDGARRRVVAPAGTVVPGHRARGHVVEPAAAVVPGAGGARRRADRRGRRRPLLPARGPRPSRGARPGAPALEGGLGDVGERARSEPLAELRREVAAGDVARDLHEVLGRRHRAGVAREVRAQDAVEVVVPTVRRSARSVSPPRSYGVNENMRSRPGSSVAVSSSRPMRSWARSTLRSSAWSPTWSAQIHSKYVAKPSFSQMSCHDAGGDQSPNHWCASSWARIESLRALAANSENSALRTRAQGSRRPARRCRRRRTGTGRARRRRTPSSRGVAPPRPAQQPRVDGVYALRSGTPAGDPAVGELEVADHDLGEVGRHGLGHVPDERRRPFPGRGARSAVRSPPATSGSGTVMRNR